MGDIETVRVKNPDDAGGYMTINKSDFDPKKHQAFDSSEKVSGDGLSDEERAEYNRLEAKRRFEANRGITGGAPAIGGDRNPSGTFSEPTPSDIRYPNKDATEFENNHGAFVRKSAADIRAEQGMEDKPGGLNPEVKEAVDAASAAAQEASQAAAQGSRPGRKPAEPTENVDDMTVAQLREYAEQNSIDLGSATRKDEILEKVKAASA